MQAETKLKYGRAGVPFIRPSWRASRVRGTNGHICHCDLIDVRSWVLGCGESTGGGLDTGDYVGEGFSTGLAWVAAPEEGVDLYVK